MACYIHFAIKQDMELLITELPTSLVAGRDFTPFVDLQLTFTAGATEVCEPVTVAQDNLVEVDEFFSVTITRTDFSLGPIISVQITIEDSDRELNTTLY